MRPDATAHVEEKESTWWEMCYIYTGLSSVLCVFGVFAFVLGLVVYVPKVTQLEPQTSQPQPPPPLARPTERTSALQERNQSLNIILKVGFFVMVSADLANAHCM